MLKIKETKIIRSKRRSIAMTISPNATLVVRAPQYMPMFFINRFIKQNEEWIEKQLAKIQTQVHITKKQYKHGEKFLYLGMELNLEVGNYQEISIQKDKLLFPEALMFRTQKQLTTWYQKQAREFITQQVEYYALQMGTTYKSLTFSDTKSQWGRCTSDNRLQFNWRLIMSPLLTINYVVVHELAHTMEKNHSRKFWQIVGTYCPSYMRQRKWLNKYGKSLVV